MSKRYRGHKSHSSIIVPTYSSRIKEVIGEKGKLLTDFIPNLQLIIGQQKHVAASLGPTAKNRLIFVFVNFFKAICSLHSPVVLVLEDLQLLDEELLDLLSVLVTDKHLKNIMFIGTYRADEVSSAHPLSCLIQNIRKSNISMINIKLNNLSHEPTNDFISNTLKIPPLKSHQLSVLIRKKTKGNPYFMTEMLKSLVAQGIIFHCNQSGSWKWKEDYFNTEEISIDVLEILRNKIDSFNSDVRRTLMIAACLGSPFYLSTLELTVGDRNCIENVLSTGMIVPCQGSSSIFRFSHDKVQEAITSLVSNDADIYLNVGMKLWKNLSNDALESNIFPLSNLICRALDRINNKAIRSKAARLFLFASRKAMSLTAYEMALKYAEAGIESLDGKHWEDNDDFVVSIYNNACEAAYCAKQYDRMNELMNMIDKNSTSVLRWAQSCMLRMNSYKDQAMFLEGYEEGKRFLSSVGHEVNVSNSEFEIKTAIALFKQTSNEDILSKLMSDERSVAIMMIL